MYKDQLHSASNSKAVLNSRWAASLLHGWPLPAFVLLIPDNMLERSDGELVVRIDQSSESTDQDHLLFREPVVVLSWISMDPNAFK
jgi:hypothetical protein